MFHNNLLKKCAEVASQFKVPYLVPQSTGPCNYCQLLKNYPGLSGTHENGCESNLISVGTHSDKCDQACCDGDENE